MVSWASGKVTVVEALFEEGLEVEQFVFEGFDFAGFVHYRLGREWVCCGERC